MTGTAVRPRNRGLIVGTIIRGECWQTVVLGGQP